MFTSKQYWRVSSFSIFIRSNVNKNKHKNDIVIDLILFFYSA